MHPVAVKEQTPQQVGFYRVAEEIGRGQVAVVYRATDTLYDREVALKVLHPYFAHYLAFVRHFIAEGREMARLHHPNIVPLLDAGQAGGVTYIAQDLVIGGTLADLLRARNGPFTIDETLAVVEQVAAGLDYAHHQGLLHRNLKPSNIFVADQGRVQLADFSALWQGSSPLPANFAVGSPAFMAPEQARGESTFDQRADIYSLGVIAFLMLTGRLPFVADNALVLLRKVVDEPPPLANELNPALPASLAQTLCQVLAKQPQARYVTAGAFAQALGVAADQPPPRPALAVVSPPLPVSAQAAETVLPLPLAQASIATEATLRPDWRILTLLGILGTVLVALVLNAAFYYVDARLTPIEQTEPRPPAPKWPLTRPRLPHQHHPMPCAPLNKQKRARLCWRCRWCIFYPPCRRPPPRRLG
jgi:serine/threonine protein kinase